MDGRAIVPGEESGFFAGLLPYSFASCALVLSAKQIVISVMQCE